MASFTVMAGQKRSRGEDEDADWDYWEPVEEIKKRPRHEELVNSVEDLNEMTPKQLPLFSSHHDNMTTRPPLHRAQPLAFRMPTSGYMMTALPMTTPTSNASSNPSPIMSTPYDRSPISAPSPESMDSPPTLMECNPHDGDDVEMSDDQLMSSEASIATEEDEQLNPRIRIRHSSSPPSLNFSNRPPRLNSQKLYNYHPLSPGGAGGSALSTGRIPTPIHPFFPGNPSPRTHPSLISPTPLSSASSIFSASRAMPSPIREDTSSVDLAGSHLSKLSVSGAGLSPIAGGEVMSLDDPLSPTSSGGLLSPPLEFDEHGLPIRKGRARSGAITSPVMPNKRIFTGYLATCEKCRNKVPGHYLHFL